MTALHYKERIGDSAGNTENVRKTEFMKLCFRTCSMLLHRVILLVYAGTCEVWGL